MLEIYNILLKEFGRQNWWPVKSRDKKSEIIIGAILTQNTSWKNAEKALDNLEKENLISLAKIKDTNINKIKKLIRPSGFYNQKAERLKEIAEFFFRNKPTREQLLNLKGIGKETADSILLYAYNKPFFVIDAYTRRIMERLGYKFESYEELQQLFMKALPKDYKTYKEFHALLVELAKRNCRKIPVCEGCVLRSRCNFQ